MSNREYHKFYGSWFYAMLEGQNIAWDITLDDIKPKGIIKGHQQKVKGQAIKHPQNLSQNLAQN